VAVQPQAHARAAALGSLHDDPAAVRVRDLLDDREAEAEPGWPRAVRVR
jgi:hypothetical protein